MKQWLLALGAVLALTGGWYAWKFYWRVEEPILVGILHSKSGPLEISERSMIDAELMAIDEINQQGGLLGREIKPVIADGRSDPKVFAQEARRLIETEKVSVIFGCWTSLCRRSVKSVVEASNHLLFFSSNYEGMDISSSIVCTGPIPNQQVIPAVNWCFETLKARKFFLAGSADVQSYSSNALIKDQLKALGAQTVGEKYVALDGTGMPEMIAAIKTASPDLILSTVVGDGNKRFYQQLAQSGLTPARMPVLSFTIAEDELRELPVNEMVGDYAAWSYFQSIDTPVNRAFVERFKKRYGSERTTSDSIVAAYNSVQLWAQAVVESGDGVDVRRPSRDQPPESRCTRRNRLGRRREPAHLATVLSGQDPGRCSVRGGLEPGEASAASALPCPQIAGRVGRLRGKTLHDLGHERLQSPDADRFSRACDHAGQAPGLAAFPKPAASSIQKSRSYQR